MKKLFCLILSASFCLASAAEEDLKAQALREQKPCMVLCVGGDWCVSGESVRKVFESRAFRKSLKGEWLFGVQDRWDRPCPASVSNENARVKSLNATTQRYPALVLFDKFGERFANLENIPFDVKGEVLARKVTECDAVRAKAVEHFYAGRHGEGLDLIRQQTSSFMQGIKRKGQVTFKTGTFGAQWAALEADTSEDAESWKLSFELGEGYAEVNQANALAEKPQEGTNYIAKLRARPMRHCTVAQRQSVEMAEFALIRRQTNSAPRCVELLRKVHAMGPDTIWGWAAQGYLKNYDVVVPPAETNAAKSVRYGEGIVDRPMRPCGIATPAADAAAKLSETAKAAVAPLLAKAERSGAVAQERDPPGLGASDQLALVRARAWRQIGTNAVQRVLEREGGERFVKQFFNDQTWLEEFCASGPVDDNAAAFTNLATLVWNEPAAEKEGLARRIATAQALNTDKKSPMQPRVRSLAAYLFLAQAGRLHRAALTQSVREWRFAICDGSLAASDILWLNYFENVPHETYSNGARFVPYRMFNCFGEFIHRPQLYYGPWQDCTWPRMREQLHVGGVCGVLSTFGARTTNAHGLPATPGGQPGHCIFNRRQLDGRWTIHNYVSRYSTARYSFWGRPWTFLDVIERSFADREKQLQADRLTWLAHFAKDAGAPWAEQEKWHQRAVAANPRHYGAWLAYASGLTIGKATPEQIHAYLEALVKDMSDGRQATWHAANICLQYLAKLPQGPSKVVEELEWMYPKLPRPKDVPTREEMDFSSVINQQLRMVQRPELKQRLFKAALAAQTDMNDDFYRQLMQAGATSRDLYVFRAAAEDFERRSPVPADAARWPLEDFGGRLISDKGMLMVSSAQVNWNQNHPELYARALGPLRVVDPAHPRRPGTFQTRPEKAPWACVVLPTATNEVSGIVLTNPFGKNSARQVPFTVTISKDGKHWNQIAKITEVKDVYRFKLEKPVPARFVKISRVPSDRKEPFHFSKILIYGK